MIDVLSVENMRKSDAATIAGGIPGTELMMRAAKGIFEAVSWKPPVLIVCGSGNNAGDGYALALLLDEADVDCALMLLSEKFSEDGKYYYDRCIKRGIRVYGANKDPETGAEDMSGWPAPGEYETIVDCILGTGFKGSVRPDIARAIERINESGAYVVSADINSGLNGDTGMAKKCVISDVTVSIGSYKPGHFLNMAKDVMKSHVNCDIGIKPMDDPYKLIEASDIAEYFGPRKNFSNKGSYGYTALIGGSLKYSGAIRLAYMANAAMRAGAGVVKAAVPGSLVRELIPHILESTVFPMPDNDGEFVYDESRLSELVGNVKTAAFGMGAGVSEDTAKMLEYLLDNYEGRLIVDADGLTLLSQLDTDRIRSSRPKLILTPHIKEFSRLSGLTKEQILEAPVESALKYAKDTGSTVLLKGPSTIITDGNMVYITDRGCSGMATAGSGDVLSGILAAVCGYIDDPLMAAAAGAHINGLAGELAEAAFGSVSMIASDTASYVPEAVSVITKTHHNERVRHL